MNNYAQLCLCAEQLTKSERGARALKNLSAFFRDGGTGLDEANKRAAIKLFAAGMETPWDLPAELTSKEAA